MAYDEDLADRIRVVLSDRTTGPVEERKMFGGLGFMVEGKMAVAAAGYGGLMVPVGKGQAAVLADAEAHVEPMRMGARVSTSWVLVAAPALADDATLAEWVDRGLAVVSTR